MKKLSLLLIFAFQAILIGGLFSSMPAYAEDATPMVAISNSHTVALKADGTVWSWGQGGNGEMGNGTTYDWTAPLLSLVQANITDVKYIAVGNGCTYAIKKDGTLWSWGFNGNGELGLGDKIDRNVPTQIPGLTDVIQVAGTNGAFAACLKADGTVYAWGTNNAGQLGNGTTTGSTIPVQATATGFTDIREIDVAGNHVVARKGDGTVWTWGSNSRKQCGRGAQNYFNGPGQVTTTGVENIVKVRAGGSHTAVLKGDGTVWTWGNNGSGQLGKGYELVSLDGLSGEYWKSRTPPYAVYDPAQVAGLTGITDINAGSAHTVIKKSDGTVWSVGMNFRGEFGDGNCLANNIPYASAEFRQALITGPLMQIESFEFNTAFLKTDGSLWTCGANSTGQVGNGTTSLYVDVPSKVPGLNLIADEILVGDVNGSGTVNLVDAVSALQMLSGISTAPSVHRRADVNSDGKIGWAEVIYVLQKVAGIRQDTRPGGTFTLTSTAFTEGATIPTRYTYNLAGQCSGENVLPALAWTNPPANTKNFAITMHDPDGGNWVHWVQFNIPSGMTSLTEVPGGPDIGVKGLNDFGELGYGGPCPPSGNHHYIFTLYALDATLGLTQGATRGQVNAAMAGHILGQATLTGMRSYVNQEQPPIPN